MNATLTRSVAAAVACALLAACAGGGSSPVAHGVALPAPVSPGSGSVVPYGAGLLANASYLGLARVKTVGLDVFVSMRDEAGLERYARDANDPTSATYRHWLTPQEIGDRFGASPGDYDGLARSLVAQGIAVKTYPQRQMVRVNGPQGNVERALGLSFGIFRSGTHTFLAPATAPRVPSNLRVAGLGNAVGYTTRSRNLVPVRAANSFIQGYTPQQIANAFDYTGAYAAGYTGAGINIGIIGTGPITDGDSRVSTGDVADFKQLFGLGGAGVVTQIVDTAHVSPGTGTPGSSFSTGLATPPPVTSPRSAGCVKQGYMPGNPATAAGITDLTTCNPEDAEAQLDTEQAAALAPDANVLFYIAYNPVECFGPCGIKGSAPPSPQIGLSLTDDEIQQAIADDKADIISMSFGGSEPSSNGIYFGAGSNEYGTKELAALASMGVAMFASSGDAGAEGCTGDVSAVSRPNNICVGYPATDPSVVSVGGVNTPLDASGRLTGPLTGWGIATQIPGQHAGGSGGGCSTFFNAPAYETGIAGFPCGGKRAQPDISLDADTSTGVAVVVNAATELGTRNIAAIGGTSVGAPEMAAMWALVLQACQKTASCTSKGSGLKPYRLGNPNAAFFTAYKNPVTYASTFADVLFGNNALPGASPAPGMTGIAPNGGYDAGTGYDLVTGLGVPYARNLIRAVVGV